LRIAEGWLGLSRLLGGVLDLAIKSDEAKIGPASEYDDIFGSG
jgi:hypothetical protein